jgi:hypothetical protein
MEKTGNCKVRKILLKRPWKRGGGDVRVNWLSGADKNKILASRTKHE